MPENNPRPLGNSNSSTLHITAYCLNKLLEAILNKLGYNHKGILNTGISQIYGFGNYDEKAPSLKKDLESISGAFVNGKYLYDKKREVLAGKPVIKLNRPYKHILFEYLGYENLESFLKENIKDQEERLKQLELISSPEKNQTYYYVSYHFGEYKEIVKAQATVKDNWKSLEYKYLYPQDDGSIKTFTYFGDIKKRADALHIQTRTFMDGKMVPGGETILYIGYGDPAKSKYMLGVFSAFDINNRLIAVKSIHEKCTNEEEMIRKANDPKVPAYIVQEIRNQRIENEIHIPNDKLEISEKSPYYLTYEKIAGEYTFAFITEENDLHDISIRIDPNNFKVSSLIPSILINKDEIELIHNGSVLNLRFKLSGLASFLQLDIYVKTYYLNENSKKVQGIFSGIDFENRLVSGKIEIDFTSIGKENVS